MTFHATERKNTLTLQDDPATSSFLSPPSLISGGGGLCSTTADYLTFCRALINGGELGGVQAARPENAAADDIEPPARRRSTCPALSRSLFSEADL